MLRDSLLRPIGASIAPQAIKITPAGLMPSDFSSNIFRTVGAEIAPLYAARIEDLGPGDFVRVDCAACYNVALLTPEALLRSD